MVEMPGARHLRRCKAGHHDYGWMLARKMRRGETIGPHKTAHMIVYACRRCGEKPGG